MSKTTKGNRRRRRADRTKTLKIGYCNINGQSKRKWKEIVDIVNGAKWDIVCLTEVGWQGNKGVKQLPGYKGFVQTRSGVDGCCRSGGGGRHLD